MSENNQATEQIEAWREANSAFLSDAVQWIVLLLERNAQDVQPAPTVRATPAPQEPPRSLMDRLFGRRRAARAPDVEPAVPAHVTPTNDAVAKAKEAMEASASHCDPGPALWFLARQFGLDDFEASIILLLAAYELNTRVGWLCGQAARDPRTAYPTFGLVLTLFENSHWSALSPDRPLRAWRLIELHSFGPASPMISSAMKLDGRILNFLKGLNHLDERLTTLLLPIEAGPVSGLAPSQGERVAEVLDHWKSTRGTTVGLPLVQLVGSDSAGKWQVARRAAAKAGRTLYRLPAEHLLGTSIDIDILARLWEREARLWPVALFVDADEAGVADPEHPDLLESSRLSAASRFLSRGRSHAFLAVRDPLAKFARASVLVEVAKPTPFEQASAWSKTLEPGSIEAGLPARLVSQFNLDWPSIHGLARRAAPSIDTVADRSDEAIWTLCRKATRPRLDGLAQRVDARATWDDLILPGRARNLLRQVAAQARRRYQVHADWGFAQQSTRGLGIAVLFAGESGTGKTMAAEVLANELKVDLYRVDASAVISKYIGQTEKYLRQILDSFEDSGAVLMFDEADSLFSKRTEIKDSHDRYANQEVNYLLQRLESYRGVAILATNFQSAIEPAFLRRLRFTIEFLAPGTAERARLWKGVFPDRAPLGELDYEALALLPLNGGAIRSIAVNAAFEAAEAGTPVEMEHIWRATRDELLKLGRPVPASLLKPTARPRPLVDSRAPEGVAP
jgi:ATPase family associated with various cellular activities (AAA)/Winged helix domain, variant